MNLTQTFLKYLPKKYHNRFGGIEIAEGLIEDCKYIIYTSSDYIFEEGGNNLPCKSIKEAIEYIKYSTVGIS